MDELIRVKNADYDRYVELLMRRDALKKQAFEYDRAYVREFGDLILEIFQIKMECIRKKKTIEYCQRAANYGEKVDQDKLQDYLKKELEEFQTRLDNMVKDNEAAKNATSITERELLSIKRIYHRLVKKIHPDINPAVEKSEALQELWQRVLTAYTCNDLKLMEETEILINQALEQMGDKSINIDIPNMGEKISELEEEINTIRANDPYQYKFLLESSQAVEEKKADLTREKKAYQDYSEQLEEILNKLLEDGVRFTWKMN